MKYVGIDIGGMTIKGGIVDEKGNILARKVVVTSPGKEDFLIVQDIANLIEDLVKDCKDEIEGIGIGCPGSIYDEKGIVRYSCNINFRNTPMARMIAEKTQIKNVKLSNDANCAALGETMFGAGNGAKNSVMVTLGTGVGTGIVADGKLITGNRSAGAEGGHIQINLGGAVCGCGKKGCLEQYASATGIVRMAKKLLASDDRETTLKNVSELTAKDIFDAAKAGDAVAKELVEKLGKVLGNALANVACVVNPEIIVIGGGVSKAGSILIDVIQKHYVETTFHACRKAEFALATLGNQAGMYGCVQMLLDM